MNDSNTILQALRELNKQERIEKKKFFEKYLMEGTDYKGQAIKMLVDSGLYNEELSTEIINMLQKEDIHAFVHAPAWLEKYLKGIVRMLIQYANGDKEKGLGFLYDCGSVFDKYLTYVKDIRPKLQPNEIKDFDDKFLNKMSYEDVKNENEKRKEELDKESKEKLSKMEFKGTSDYELIPIESYNQFHELFGGKWTGDQSNDKAAGNGGTAWCYANGENTYDSWVEKGKYKFFILANKNWKNIEFNEESNKYNPKDEYGNSLIGILVKVNNGSLQKATLRCNHIGVKSNVDNQYTSYAELSEIAGFNVEKKVQEILNIDLEELERNRDKLNELMKTFDGSKENLNNILKECNLDRSDLTELTISDNVINIENGAFHDCTGLRNIEIPNSVQSIGYFVFNNCTALKSITIGNNVRSIGQGSFYYCNSLKKVFITDIDRWCNIDFYDYDSNPLSYAQNLYLNEKLITNLEIPNNVTSIGDWAFINLTSVKNVTLSNNLIKIGNGSFQNCTTLTSITIPHTVTSIGDYGFYYCKRLDNINYKTGTKSEFINIRKGHYWKLRVPETCVIHCSDGDLKITEVE